MNANVNASPERSDILAQMRTIATRSAADRRKIRTTDNANLKALLVAGLKTDAKALDMLKIRLLDFPK